ncbi:MAG: DUF6585 family protein [bacterium]|nr:DUF6585 family protein [bacterium]
MNRKSVNGIAWYHFYTDTALQWRRVGFLLTSVIFGVVFLVSFSSTPASCCPYESETEAFSWTTTPWEFILASGAIAIYLGIRLLNARAKRIDVYDDGFVIAARGNQHFVRWQEIKGMKVFQSLLRQSFVYRLHLSQDQHFDINNDIAQWMALGALIYARMSEVLARQLLDTLQSGASYSVADVTFLPDGLRQGEQFVSYDDIQSWQTDGSKVTIRCKGNAGVGMLVRHSRETNAEFLTALLYVMLGSPQTH